jgi:hypothetical protein
VKKTIAIFAISLLSSLSAFAANLDVLTKVVTSDAAKELTQSMAADGYTWLEKVELTATYRCIGCYEYSMTFAKNTEQGNRKRSVGVLATSAFSRELQVSIKDGGTR